MDYASRDLIDEHEGILFGLKILEKMANLLKGKEKVEVSDIKDMVEFFQLFADKCHHGKEEGFLFPAMEKYGIPRENGPIGQMLSEHVEGRKYIAQMADSAKDELRTDSFIDAARNYINLLRSHIDKENNVLFPLGDKKIPPNVQTELLESFEKYEEEIMGRGTHEKLHILLSAFEKKYLS
jgi:hemerythrin-like domain-containing protein